MNAAVSERLAEIARLRQNGKDPVTLHRRAVCEGCESVMRMHGGIRCMHCRCVDPAAMRPRCPIGKWGVTPLSRCRHYVEAPSGCAIGGSDCMTCEDREE